MASDATVKLWGSVIGAVSWLSDRQLGVFQYAPEFADSGVQLAPLHMPLREFPYEFPALSRDTFMGLPGMLADSLPDKYGNAVIDAWLAGQGRDAASFHPVERLCYVGTRGMGALEFEPAIMAPATAHQEVEVAELVRLANAVLDERAKLKGVFSNKDDKSAIDNILRVGTSAGGARPKAILAWNPETNAFRSGQMHPEAGFEHWLMKFDGVVSAQDREIASPLGYGRVEYAYYLMAREAGISMEKCRLHHEGGRSHFMTRRFDRTHDGGKLHMQTLGAMAHYDYRLPGYYSYEQAVQVTRRLQLPRTDTEEMVLRAMFNVTARNCDDHVKNIAFLMDRRGVWTLAPAYDVTYAWNPVGEWTSRHQMSLNGKRDDIGREDLVALAATAGIKKRPAENMIDQVTAAVRRWPEFAEKAGIEEERMRRIQENHGLL